MLSLVRGSAKCTQTPANRQSIVKLCDCLEQIITCKRNAKKSQAHFAIGEDTINKLTLWLRR